MSELVSVIIPTHKGSQLVAAAVKSVQNQTYRNLEIIVVDDNGLGTEEQIKTQQAVQAFMEDPRFSYYVHEKNKNGSAARNTGFYHSQGKYIALLDDDDEYLPNKIDMEYNALKELDDEWGMVYCAGQGTLRRKMRSGDLLYPLLLHTVVIGSNSFLVRRNVWEKVGGFDESFRRHQDFEFTAKVASVCKIKGLSEVGYIYNADVGRNKPKNIQLLQEHRAHYINKMLPLIRRFSPFKQKVIICSNSMQVTSPYLRKGNIVRFLKELRRYMSQWTPECGLFVIVYVSIMKVWGQLTHLR